MFFCHPHLFTHSSVFVKVEWNNYEALAEFLCNKAGHGCPDPEPSSKVVGCGLLKKKNMKKGEEKKKEQNIKPILVCFAWYWHFFFVDLYQPVSTWGIVSLHWELVSDKNCINSLRWRCFSTYQHTHGAHSHRLVLQLRTVSHLHSSIESIHVNMHNHSSEVTTFLQISYHPVHLLQNIERNK